MGSSDQGLKRIEKRNNTLCDSGSSIQKGVKKWILFLVNGYRSD